MLYVDYEKMWEVIRKQEQEMFELINQREEIFNITQPKATTFDKEKVDGFNPSNINEKYIAKKEYLDNFQYRETKNFKKNPSKPSIVIHRRLGDIYGATVEEVQYIKTTTDVRPGNSVDKNRPGQLKSILKQNKSEPSLSESLFSVNERRHHLPAFLNT